MSYWIGVASREHVHRGVELCVCQLGHGKEAPVRRLKRGDVVIYYSPHERIRAGAPVHAFTAAGQILDDVPHQVDAEGGFAPWRRQGNFFSVTDAPIEPLLNHLSFTRGHANWGMAFRRNAFEIADEDYRLIAHALGIEDALTAASFFFRGSSMFSGIGRSTQSLNLRADREAERRCVTSSSP